MEPISVRALAAALGKELEDERPVTRISADSRAVAPGSLFVCIRGERFDGHDYAAEAAARGALYVVAQRTVPLPEDRVLYVDSTLEANIALAGAYRRRFSPLCVGITGSVGKTTAKEFTAAVLSRRYRTLKTPGNQNNEIGVPAALCELDGSVEALVAEMGMNAPGDVGKLARAVLPDIGVITWIGVSHIERLGSRENILRAKLEITLGMKDGAPLILCGDNGLLRGVRDGRLRIVRYGIDDPTCDVRAEGIVSDGEATSFRIVRGGERFAARIPAIGRHNVYNALAAFAAGHEAGIPPDEILAGFAGYSPAGMRQKVVRRGGVTVVEDCYNASPDSMEAALRAFGEMKVTGRRVAVFGDMLELGGAAPGAHRAIGRSCARAGIDALFCVGDFAEDMAGAARAAGLREARAFGSKAALANGLAGSLSSGDAAWFKASRGVRLEEALDAVYLGLGTQGEGEAT